MGTHFLSTSAKRAGLGSPALFALGAAGILTASLLALTSKQEAYTPTPTCLGKQVTVNLSLGHQPTDGPDVILGTPKDDTIFGLGGDDTICGNGGQDRIYGGLGNDTLQADGGTDYLYGDGGNDTLHGDGSDELWDAEGNNSFILGAHGATVFVGQGKNTFQAANTGLRLRSFQALGPLTLDAAKEELSFNGIRQTLQGVDFQADWLVEGSPFAGDTLRMGRGRDTILAQDGQVDTIGCGAGEDLIYHDQADKLEACEESTTGPFPDTDASPVPATPPTGEPGEPVRPEPETPTPKPEVKPAPPLTQSKPAPPAKRPTTGKLRAGAKVKKGRKLTVRWQAKKTLGYECKVDAGKWKACKSGWKVKTAKLKRGKHTALVRAKKGKLVDRTPSRHTFRVS